jgi:hypothetical protein
MTVYTEDVLAMADHLFPLFPTLTGLEILAIASEATEFQQSRATPQERLADLNRRDY